ncbi:low molecular weight protein-tyrosine-phosphatase [Sulfurovum sp. CS9]|uniref:low molecular weight protein-tyrosine-phosphatase n=1 Tax=Sulfurovum sp. CS9 TaxID=3391146 RepID=UPI0039E99A38
MKRILFVCIGNICRSPLAEGIARKIAKESNLDITVDSAGTSGWHERELPCDSSIKIAALNDVDISKMRARQVRKSDYIDFDYIVAIDAKIKEKLETLGSSNVYLLGDFGGYKGIDVPDPLFLNAFDDDIREIYSVYTMIESCVKDFIAQKC